MSKHIFFIHGMWGASWVFDGYRAWFEAQGYQCHTPTLRHHGNPQSAEDLNALGRTSLLDYADDLETEIREHMNTHTAAPIVVGHSMGGLLAQMLAARGLVSQLVLVSPAAPAGILATTPSVLRSFAGVMSRWGFWRKANKISFRAAQYAVLNGLPLAQQRALYDQFGYESGRAAFESGFWLLDTHKASRVEFKNVTCPVLILSGKNDRITPNSVHRNIARKYPQAQLNEYPNNMHCMMDEPNADDIAADIKHWLEQTTKA